MSKQAPSIGGRAAIALFVLSCFGILLYLWVAFGGSVPLRSEGYRFTVAVPEASTLVEEADVRLAGVNVGKVKTRDLEKDTARTLVTIELEPAYAPIPQDTRAMLRQKTLLGETYVELTPGDPRSGMLDDGEALNPRNVQSTVELDEIFRIFDARTREGFRGWVQEGAKTVSGDFDRDFNDALGNLAPFATAGNDLFTILDDQEGAVQGVVRDTGRVFNALAAEEGQLRGLIRNGNETFEALASRDDALAETFAVLPTFLRETRTTLRRLDTFAGDTRPLVNDLKGPADDLAPTLRDLRGLAPDLKNLFRDLDPLIVAAERSLPAGSRFLDGIRPVLSGLNSFLPELNPILSRLMFSRQEVAQFLTVGGAALAGNGRGGYLGDGGAENYLPQIALIDSQSLGTGYRQRPSFDRGNAYPAPNAYNREIGFGVQESFDCAPTGGEKPQPTDGSPPLFADAQPPCFVQPPLLFQNQKFPKLRRGGAPRTPAPAGREGTEPARP